MGQTDPLGPGAMAIEWHTQNCIFRKDLGEMVTVGVAISGWFKRCLEGGVGLVMDRLWRQGEGGHMDDPWDLACLAVPFARPDLQEGCSGRQTVVDKAFTLLVPPTLVWYLSIFPPAILSYPRSSSIGILLSDVEKDRVKEFRVLIRVRRWTVELVRGKRMKREGGRWVGRR